METTSEHSPTMEDPVETENEHSSTGEGSIETGNKRSPTREESIDTVDEHWDLFYAERTKRSIPGPEREAEEWFKFFMEG